MDQINLKDKFNIDGKGTLSIYEIDKDKPLILIFPGGGYHHLSPRESLPVSNKFNSLGYNTAILRYSVSPYSYPTQLNEANASLEYLLTKYNKIFLLGFSAGGHLAGLCGTDKYYDKICGMILCYPVISLHEYTHIGTQTNLLKNMNTKENQIKYSIQNRVNKNTSPCFIWCTKEDNAVPYENSIIMNEALKKHNIYSEIVIFPHGPHGMALADDTATSDNHLDCKDELVATWPSLVDNFIKKVIKND